MKWYNYMESGVILIAAAITYDLLNIESSIYNTGFAFIVVGAIMFVGGYIWKKHAKEDTSHFNKKVKVKKR